MGDIADSMLIGDMCQECGVWLGDGDGYPRSCSACGGTPRFGGAPDKLHENKQWKCKACGKAFKKKRQLRDHCSSTGHSAPAS